MEFDKKEIRKIIWTSLKHALKWSIWKWLLSSSIGALTGTLRAGETFFNLDLKRSITYGIIFIVVLYLIRFVIILYFNVLKYYHEVYKNSVYGDAIVMLNECYAEIHYYRKVGYQDSELIELMILFCTSLKKTFDMITKSNCSVSIMIPVRDKKVIESSSLKCLTRDKEHRDRDTSIYAETTHNIIGNTAFNNTLNKVITNQREKYYVNSSVNKTINYLNTSKTCYKDGILPYNSELVHPITLKKSFHSMNYECHGFLCVDSELENAFDNQYCIAIVEGACDGIFDLIFQQNNKNHDNH